MAACSLKCPSSVPSPLFISTFSSLHCYCPYSCSVFIWLPKIQPVLEKSPGSSQSSQLAPTLQESTVYNTSQRRVHVSNLQSPMMRVFISWKSVNTTNQFVQQLSTHHCLCCANPSDLMWGWRVELKLISIGVGKTTSDLSYCCWIRLPALQWVLWLFRDSVSLDISSLPSASSLSDAAAGFMTVGLSSSSCFCRASTNETCYHLALLQILICKFLFSFVLCGDSEIRKLRHHHLPRICKMDGL